MTRIAIATERNSLCMRHPSNTSGRALTPCHDLTSCGLPDHTTHLAKGHHPTPTDALPASGSTRTRIDTEAVEQRFAPVRCDPACSNPPAHVAFTRASCLRLFVRGDVACGFVSPLASALFRRSAHFLQKGLARLGGVQRGGSAQIGNPVAIEPEPHPYLPHPRCRRHREFPDQIVRTPHRRAELPPMLRITQRR